MELAQEQINDLQGEFRRKRTLSIVLAVVFLFLAVILAIPVRLPMMAFCSIVISIIFLLRYFDANGQLHDVDIRSKKTLYPRLSLL